MPRHSLDHDQLRPPRRTHRRRRPQPLGHPHALTRLES
jgi:hypothetical protein